MSLQGQTAIITGGTKNLGAETSKLLAGEGINLFLQYRSNKEQAERFKAELSKEFPHIQVEIYQTALDKADENTKLFEVAKSKFPKGLDFAINNIGKVVKKPIVEVTEKEFDEMHIANNKSAFFFIKEAAKNLNDNGAIVSLVTSLLAAYVGNYAIYQGLKAPVQYYSKAASQELKSRGISVNTVAPGPMNTEFLINSEPKEAVEFYKTQAIGNRLTEVSDIAPIIKFLLKDGKWITGHTMFASGGFT
ncbi:unnamed protein product [Candida verbasci]|uniref:Short-chain dehydrogenase n=1 Tax=Candida verbasci TaxID=1227364 RepID=A0A9W4TZG4_9ASCO|nr:unnamed protein product [Candida verbasci]